MKYEMYENLNPNIFLFVERKDTPNWVLNERQNGFHELYFVVEGKAVYSVNDQTFIVKPGDIVYIPGGSIREAHAAKESLIHSYIFNFFWFDDNHISLPFKIVTKDKITYNILSYLKEFSHIWTSKPPIYRMKARGLFLLILQQLLHIYDQGSETYMDPRIKKVIEHMTNNYSECFDIDVMARLTNLHPVYLGKLFKQNTGSTLKEFLNRIRVNNAEKMLASSDFSVSEVAVQCGFNDVFYFSKMFKNIRGYPPSSVAKE